MRKRSRKLSPEMRAAISAFLSACQKEARPFATAEALGAVRRVFPAISSEATSAGFEVDTPEPRSAARMKDALEKWDNEGGAIKNRAPVEAHGIRANDKDGKGRRAKAIKDRNELL